MTGLYPWLRFFRINAMQKLLSLVSILCAALWLSAFQAPTAPAPTAELRWYSWEEAVELSKTKPKKMFVDVYTDWCGWCKRMDKSTFSDPAVVAYLTENFYPVKLNAEQRADIQFGTETFKFVETEGGRGVHTLAYSLLDGRLGYPAMVYLNEKFERIMISPGYKEVPDMLKELRFAAEEHYNKTSWEEYRQKN
jgi:thioredoxin-related protein